MKPTVLICGASLAGPATAFWLLRAGFAVTIVEQAAELRRGGNGVDIREEALSVIDRMNLSAAVREKAIVTKACGSLIVTIASVPVWTRPVWRRW